MLWLCPQKINSFVFNCCCCYCWCTAINYELAAGLRVTLSTFNASYSRCCSSLLGDSCSWSRAAVISSELCKVSRVTCHNPCRLQTHFFAMLCLPNFAQKLLHFAQISTYLHLHIQLTGTDFFWVTTRKYWITSTRQSPGICSSLMKYEKKISILSSLHSKRIWFSVSQQLAAEDWRGVTGR